MFPRWLRVSLHLTRNSSYIWCKLIPGSHSLHNRAAAKPVYRRHVVGTGHADRLGVHALNWSRSLATSYHLLRLDIWVLAAEARAADAGRLQLQSLDYDSGALATSTCVRQAPLAWDKLRSVPLSWDRRTHLEGAQSEEVVMELCRFHTFSNSSLYAREKHAVESIPISVKVTLKILNPTSPSRREHSFHGSFLEKLSEE